ncbi:MAG: hypothetical protein SFW09_18465 [Hyphomicrobiaceae bacterium]|nr:hypothetical protein [Hyphomicrobiaceae bacterium]
MTFEAGQQWTYRAPPEIADSRIVIGALVDFDGGRRIACCAVTGARQRNDDGTFRRVTVPFLPLTVEALAETVVALDGASEVPDGFAEGLSAWQDDPRGASYFTVPFEGSLERMIGQQMAAIVEDK